MAEPTPLAPASTPAPASAPIPRRPNWRVTLDFSLPREVVADVTTLAEREGYSRSRWLERAIEAWLANPSNYPAVPEGRAGAQRCRRVCITVKPGISRKFRETAAAWGVSLSAALLAAIRDAKGGRTTHRVRKIYGRLWVRAEGGWQMVENQEGVLTPIDILASELWRRDKKGAMESVVPIPVPTSAGQCYVRRFIRRDACGFRVSAPGRADFFYSARDVQWPPIQEAVDAAIAEWQFEADAADAADAAGEEKKKMNFLS